MSFWRWVSKTAEVAELEQAKKVQALFYEIVKRSPTDTDKEKLFKKVLQVNELLADARLRASIIACISEKEIDEIPHLKQGIGIHHDIGGRPPDKTELELLSRKLGCDLEIKTQYDNKQGAIFDTGLPKYALYDYQLDVIKRTHEAISAGAKRLLIHMPTGTGKTRTAMSLIARWLNSANGGVAWATYSRELIDQAREEFVCSWSYLGQYKARIGYFTGDEKDSIQNKDIIFISLSKLGRRIKDMSSSEVQKIAESISLLVIDEAHQAIAQTYGDAIDRLSVHNRSMKIIGLTATPGRTTGGDGSQDTGMAQFFSQNKVELIVKGYETPIDYLIANGYLAKPVFEDVEVEEMNSDNGNKATTEMVLQAISENHKRIIVFTESVESAYVICAVLNAVGIEAHAVDGGTPMNERSTIYQRYKKPSNKPIILINYGVLTTGFDAPLTSAVVIARPINSLIVYSQIIGRALRGTNAGGSACASIYNLYSRDEPEFRSVAKAFQHWNSLWSNR